MALERRHANTTRKTWVAYGNSHLACVYKVHKIHQRYNMGVNTRYINSTGGTF